MTAGECRVPQGNHGIYRPGPCHKEFDKLVKAGAKQRQSRCQDGLPYAYLSPEEKCQGNGDDYG